MHYSHLRAGAFDRQVGVPAFTPAALASLFRWYTAGPTWCFKNQGTIPATDGVAVRQWNDRAPTPHNLTQDTAANRPTFILSGGQWLVRFDGVEEFMRATGAISQPFTTYGVVTVVDKHGITNSYVWDGGSENENALYTGVNFWQTYSGAAGPSSFGVSEGTTYTIRLANRTGSGQAELSFNGGAVATGTFGTQSQSGFTLGSTGIGLSNYAAIDVREIVVLSEYPSAGDDALVLAYLRSQWGHY